MPPIQKILFGSPGTGKSYKIHEIAKKELEIEWNEQTKYLKNTIKTVFHPEYTYSDFVGKLLPQTDGTSSVIYKFYEGHFLRALGLAYKKIIEGTNENVLLVIDELNRGNAAAIFGSIFQLLDRDEDCWSTYEVNLSELEIVGLWRAMGSVIINENITINYSNFNILCDLAEKDLRDKSNNYGLRVLENLKNGSITIPSNLSIIATINTSDESIYYLDSAFKRRWDWEYVDVPNSKFSEDIPEKIKDVFVFIADDKFIWSDLVIRLNEFIKSHHQSIRRIEDKQIGWWFLKADKNSEITEAAIKNKLMFYLWDSVFAKDRRPLEELLGVKLITYADFANLSFEFIHELAPKKVKAIKAIKETEF
ncbi:AAA family ATPase [Nodularia spumigena CS-584]|uniref:AAA family ATPase n=1 Tax=Nodularia spumigena TaxID=70799 RepID=UPI0000EA9473|nr:AAA family ATPase [Nodularia spumigena]AHJ28889.1 restriction enzyme LlaI protein [Nodularia spumigena CCY9414]EAW45133.1 restriction enzyme LlaI protein [Nodularia spumigena CCY9414]MDB9381326.1 AAA family ATPase [Nodularia spumigena CS-584]